MKDLTDKQLKHLETLRADHAEGKHHDNGRSVPVRGCDSCWRGTPPDWKPLGNGPRGPYTVK
jgi:hypothetical protein